LRNAHGHVIGYKELLRDARTGEELAQIALFVPRYSERGDIVGYEERVRGGSVLRDVNGKRIGARWLDVRSRATNPQSKGLLIVVHGKHSDRMARAPEIEELIQLARLTNKRLFSLRGAVACDGAFFLPARNAIQRRSIQF